MKNTTYDFYKQHRVLIAVAMLKKVKVAAKVQTEKSLLEIFSPHYLQFTGMRKFIISVVLVLQQKYNVVHFCLCCLVVIPLIAMSIY